MASIGRNLSKLHRLQRQFLKPVLDPYRIPASSFSVILHVGKSAGISQKQLCDLLEMDEALITRMVHTLEKEGILYRKRNPNDLRAFQLFLTEKGTELHPQILVRLDQWWDCLLLDIPEEKLDFYLSTMTNRAIQLIKEEN